MPDTTERTNLVVMVVNQLGQHTEAIKGLKASTDRLDQTQREFNGHIKDLGAHLAGTVKKADCEKTRAELKKEIKRNGNGGQGRFGAREIIALVSVCLTFLFVVIGAVWYTSGEMSALKTAVENKPAAIGVPSVGSASAPATASRGG